MSSYHSAISKQISHLANCKEVGFNLIDTCDVLKNDSLRAEATNIRDTLIQRALDPNHHQISKGTVFMLLESSFSAWMEFNEKKLSFLSRKEPLYRYLYENPNNYKAWVRRAQNLQNWRINAEAMPDERFKSICEDCLGGALLRLIETSLRYIMLMQSGFRIYDPLMYSYHPTISMLQTGKFSNYIKGEDNNVFNNFTLLLSRAARHKYFLPSNFSNLKGDALKRAIDKYEVIRKNLNQLDKTLKSIKNEDLIYSLTDVIGEIKSNIISLAKITKAIKQGSWIVSILGQTLDSFLLRIPAFLLSNPDVCSMIAGYVANKVLKSNPYGSFAGVYADMTNSIIKEQQKFLESEVVSSSFELETSLLDKHYAPPC